MIENSLKERTLASFFFFNEEFVTDMNMCNCFEQVVSVCKNSVLLWDFCDLFDSVLCPCGDPHSSYCLQSGAEVEVTL